MSVNISDTIDKSGKKIQKHFDELFIYISESWYSEHILFTLGHLVYHQQCFLFKTLITLICKTWFFRSLWFRPQVYKISTFCDAKINNYRPKEAVFDRFDNTITLSWLHKMHVLDRIKKILSMSRFPITHSSFPSECVKSSLIQWLFLTKSSKNFTFPPSNKRCSRYSRWSRVGWRDFKP